MGVSPASAVKVFDNVAAMLDDTSTTSGAMVTVRGELLKSGDQAAQLTDDANVISISAGSSVVDADWAVQLRDTPALRSVLEQLTPSGPSGFIGGGFDDARRATVEVTGIANTEPRMFLSPPFQSIEIEPTSVRIVPKAVEDHGGFIGG